MRKATSLIIVVLCASPVFAQQEVRRDFQRTLELPQGRYLRLENSFGNVSVRALAGSAANIRATIECSADTAAEARSICEAIQILVQDTPAGASVRTEYPQGRNRRNVGFRVDYDITMPETAPLEVRNRFGNVTAGGLRAGATINNSNGRVQFSGGRGRQQIDNSFGDVEVRTNSGDLIVRNGNGGVVAADITGAVSVTNRFGSVRVTNAGAALTINSENGNIEAVNVGGAATISNSFGPVTVTDSKGDLTVLNRNGEVKATGVTGSAELRTSFGRVAFSRIGGRVTVEAGNSTVAGDTVGEDAAVQTTFGNVDLSGVKGGARVTSSNSSIRLNDIAGTVYAKTTFNGVTVSGANGPVTIENQNGSVSVDSQPGQRCQPISLQTTFGPIRVSIPDGTGYNVSARTSFGRIRSEPALTLSGEMSPNSMTGRIGGGGCELRLVGQNGNIEIVRAR